LPRRTAGKQANEVNETRIVIAADAWCKHRVWFARLGAYRPILSRKLLHHNTGGRRRHAFRVHHQCPGCHRQLGIDECSWAWLSLSAQIFAAVRALSRKIVAQKLALFVFSDSVRPR
jgi:hypothetical protein